ncbi:MAG: hypothetical protein RIQ72_282 [Candidatus Parcubacteria bacterium]
MKLTFAQIFSLIPSSDILTLSAERQHVDNHIDKELHINELPLELRTLPLEHACIDTRTLIHSQASHTIFFALAGEIHDGNAYIETAFQSGVKICIGTMSSEKVKVPQGSVYIEVTNTLDTLQAIARAYRESFLQHIHIIGITGSVGKTTTKDMLAITLEHIFASDSKSSAEEKDQTPIFATKGNLNNHIGVPLSILVIDPKQKIAILEAGMNHRGEIQVLAQIMQPDTVIITKIGVAHIEYLKTQEEIAREKSDLAIYSSRAAKVYIPADDAYATFVQSYIQEESSHKTSVILVDTLTSTLLSHTPKHIVDNISLVIACALYIAKQLNLDIDKSPSKISDEILIKSVLASQITPRRFEIKKISNNLLLIDDSYNANPDSMRASLKAFNDLDLTIYFEQDTLVAPQKIAVLGGMAELGAHSEMMHQEITHLLEQLSNIDIAISVGELAKQYEFAHGFMHFPDIQSAVRSLEELLIQNSAPHAIFVKGSKSTHMSDLADTLSSKQSQ